MTELFEQFELFQNGPYTFCIPIPQALEYFYRNYWSHLKSARQMKMWFRYLSEFFKDKYLNNIFKQDVEDFRRHFKEKGLSPTTINKGHTIITRMYSKFYEYKDSEATIDGIDWAKVMLPQKNPGTQVPKVNELPYARKVVVKKEHVFRLSSIAKSLGDQDLSEIILGLYGTMLRQGDFRQLTAANLDLHHRTLRGIQSKTVTTRLPSGVPYMVVLTDEIFDLIIERMGRVKPNGLLFPFVNMQKRFGKVRDLAGLRYVTLNDICRRSPASYLLDNGIDPRTVSEMLGHTTLRMLPVYTPRTLKHRREAAELLKQK